MELAILIEEGPRCPKCKMKMVKRYEETIPASFSKSGLTTCPPQRPWLWWCGCGHTVEGGIDQYKTKVQQARENWEAVNLNVSTIPANEGED